MKWVLVCKDRHGEIVDEDEFSSEEAARKELARLAAALEREEDCVVVWSADRLHCDAMRLVERITLEEVVGS